MPRPNLFASSACTRAIFIPGILPFLAPRVFAPWPTELGRRKLRTEPRITRERERPRSQPLRDPEKDSLEESNSLAAALGQLGFGDTDDPEQWQSSDTPQRNPSIGDFYTGRRAGEGDAQSHMEQVVGKPGASTRPGSHSTVGQMADDKRDTKSWQSTDEFDRRYNEIWGMAESDESGHRTTGSSLTPAQPVIRSLPGQEYQKPSLAFRRLRTIVERRNKYGEQKQPSYREHLVAGLASKRLGALNRRLRNFQHHKRWRYRKLLAAAGRAEMIEEYSPQQYSSLPGTISVSVMSPRDPKLQELRRRLGEKKWAELRGVFPGERSVLKKDFEHRPKDLDHELYHEILKLDGPQLSERYNFIEASRIDISPYIRTNFVHYLARKGETETAARALKTFHEYGADFSDPNIMQLCSTLLQSRFRKTESSPTDLELFDWMVACGLQPNCIIYNILIHNFLGRGDRKTAYEIYEAMKESGVEPDSYTYSILINDAKKYGEMETVQQIFQVASQAAQLDQYVLADLLHAIYLFHQVNKRKLRRRDRLKTSPLEPMFGFFRQFFFTQPFLDLIPPNRMPSSLTATLSESPERARIEPDEAILFLMLSGLLRNIHVPAEVLEYYRHFQKLVKEDHPRVRQLASTNSVYDLFLIALGRWEETLPVCAEVLQNMMSSAPAKTERLESSDESPLPAKRPLQPSVKSWSILLKAFMKHEQPRAAEKVLKMMEERGIAPTDVTWHYLIGGYAILQDVQGALDARDRMIASGFPANEETEWRLHYIQNKDALNRMRAVRAEGQRGSQMSEDVEQHEWDEDEDEWSEDHERSGSSGS